MSPETILRRLREHTGGLGYWAAVDAIKPTQPQDVLKPEARRFTPIEVIINALKARKKASK